MNSPVIRWPDEHVAMLRDCINKNMSFAEAAQAINAEFRTSYTRNALIGKAGRLGLCEKRGDRVAAAKLAKPMRRALPRLTHDRPAPSAPAAARAPLACEPLPAIEADGLKLIDLPHDRCRYPDGEGAGIRFRCGGRKHPGFSYCRDHLDIVLSGEGRDLLQRKEGALA
ncbi:GcrA family cell cycle regulator [Bradyrhizobium sp. HKCCYLR1023]|uniref:GcrA family cell cycle regulator n=1 Tax=Bradyrhizobium TaxID=374 RepID=UPI003EBAA470